MEDFRLFSKFQTLLESPTKDKPLYSPSDLDTIEEKPNHQSQPIDLSIVVVAYRENAKEIEECLNSIISSISSVSFELICVDNGLQKSAADVLREQSDIYIKANNNLGSCGGRNTAANFCKGKILMFVDADGTLESFDPSVVDKLKSSDLIAVRGQVSTPEDGSNAPPHYDLGEHEIPSLIDIEGVSLWDRDLFIKAGGFNENLKGNEGIVLGYRLITYFSASPDKFYYTPGMKLIHDFAGDTRFKGQSKQRYYFIQFLYLRKVYPGIEQYVSNHIRDRNITKKQLARNNMSRLSSLMTRVVISIKFRLYLLYKSFA